MALTQNPLFPADKVAEMLAHHAEYARLKEELFAPIVKSTSGKMNTLDVASGAKWIPYVQENPKSITDDVVLSDFINKVTADDVLKTIEEAEAKDQGVSRAKRNIISSDIRYYWTMTEDFYISAGAKDSVVKEKYKTLPSISPKRKSETEIQNAFDKLEAKRNKKNGTTPTDVKE